MTKKKRFFSSKSENKMKIRLKTWSKYVQNMSHGECFDARSPCIEAYTHTLCDLTFISIENITGTTSGKILQKKNNKKQNTKRKKTRILYTMCEKYLLQADAEHNVKSVFNQIVQ